MKKLFLSMLAAVTLFASCSEEEVVTQSNEETSTMTFKVSTSKIASRALGDGTTANKLYYAVYDESGIVESISKTTESVTIAPTANISLSLLNGKEYSIIFWAESGEGMCTVDWSKQTISLNKEELLSNQESYDAFYAYVAPFKVTSSKSETVKLNRPFAQMNIGTTAKDLDGLKAYYNSGDITMSQLKVKAYSSMNLTTGIASGNAEELTYTFAKYNEDKFPIAGYQYLSMNYLLVNNEKELMDVTLELTDDKEAVATKTFTNVPVQRNYRTNIYGQLFTSQTDWSVELLPEFEASYTVLSGHVTLQEDLTIDKPLVVTSGEVVLNLNGKKITNKKENTETDVIIVNKDATLTINGEGTIEAVSGIDGYPVIADGTVVINGGTFVTGTDADGAQNAGIYARGEGKVYINGGTFNSTTGDFLVNKKDADRETTTIEIKGGSFYKFNPANNASEGNGTNFVAEGYTSTQNGDYWVVGKAEATADELASVAANGGTVVLTDNVELTKSLNVAADLVINLNGSNIINDTESTELGEGDGIIVTGGNLTINGEGQIEANTRAIWARGNGGAVITINGGNYVGAKGNSELIYASGNGQIIINGGSFEASEKAADMGGDEYALLNCKDADYKAGTAKITVKGGKYKNFNPANNTSEGNGTNFVAEGYTSTQDGEYWVVSK